MTEKISPNIFTANKKNYFSLNFSALARTLFDLPLAVIFRASVSICAFVAISRR